MTYTQRINRIVSNIKAEAIRHERDDTDTEIGDSLDELEIIANELDETPRDKDGGAMRLLASFPYPFADERERQRVALYDKPCPSGDGTGELIIWSEAREDDHDGYREPSRFWGHYFAYANATEREIAFSEAIIAFNEKLATVTLTFARSTLAALAQRLQESEGGV